MRDHPRIFPALRVFCDRLIFSPDGGRDENALVILAGSQPVRGRNPIPYDEFPIRMATDQQDDLLKGSQTD